MSSVFCLFLDWNIGSLGVAFDKFFVDFRKDTDLVMVTTSQPECKAVSLFLCPSSIFIIRFCNFLLLGEG